MNIFSGIFLSVVMCVVVLTTMCFAGCDKKSVNERPELFVEVKKMDNISFPEMPVIVKTGNEEDIRLGGLSGLTFDSYNKNTGVYKFITNTDIGPNYDKFRDINDSFEELEYPDFIPEVVKFSLDNNTKKITIDKRIPFKVEEKTNKIGYDFEGIVKVSDNSYWFVDESIPSIVNTDSDFNIIKRYIPQDAEISDAKTDKAVLPLKYSYLKDNKGFEGIAYDKNQNKLYVFMQSPLKLDIADLNNDEYRYSWILELDIESERVTGEYLFASEKKFKISGATYYKDKEFLVLLKSKKRHYILNMSLSGATNLYDKLNIVDEESLVLKDPQAVNNFQPVYTRVFIRLHNLGFRENAKFEGISLVDTNKLALINDNDFGLLETDNGNYRLLNDENFSFLTIMDFEVTE